MQRRKYLTLAALMLSTVGSASFAQAESQIPLSQLEDMFSSMRKKTKWNVDGPLLWGYFFIDPNQEKLAKLAERLQSDDFRLVQIRQASESPVLFQLHVERVETHSPKSLHARNAKLYALAAEYRVQSYDGMDVGPAGPAAK